MTEFSRSEVAEAYRHFVAAGDSGDWNAWADLHSEDGVWVEHHLGTMRGREEIRRTILKVMKPVMMMEFPIEWHVIEGNRVVYYPWQVLPDPSGGNEVYRFGCVTILGYAGDGLWSYQEDLYNPREGEEVVVNGAFKIDSALQIRAQPSMMSPEGGRSVPGHSHGSPRAPVPPEEESGHEGHFTDEDKG